MTREQLIEQARAERKLIYCRYQQLWFGPDELEALNKQGRFRWGAVNFTLRDPQEKLNEMYKSVKRQERDIRVLKDKMSKLGRVFGTASQFDDVGPR